MLAILTRQAHVPGFTIPNRSGHTDTSRRFIPMPSLPHREAVRQTVTLVQDISAILSKVESCLHNAHQPTY